DPLWYQSIARFGYSYHRGPNQAFAFFPLIPGVMRAAGAAGLPDAVTSVVISHVALFFGLVGVFHLARLHGSVTAACWAVWICALFPSALVFSKPYPEAVFLALSTWAALAVEKRRDGAAAGLGALAALCRPNGVLLAIALGAGTRSRRRAAVVAAPPVM